MYGRLSRAGCGARVSRHGRPDFDDEGTDGLRDLLSRLAGHRSRRTSLGELQGANRQEER